MDLISEFAKKNNMTGVTSGAGILFTHQEHMSSIIPFLVGIVLLNAQFSV